MKDNAASGLPFQTVVYGRAGSHELQMDIFRPPDCAGIRPAVLCIHGGGWHGGDRRQFHWHARQLALDGFVAACVAYRLTGTAVWPAAFDDCQRAVRWLRKQAGELALDPGRIGVLGSSAGGHLAAFLGVRETRDECDPALAGISSRVGCVVDVHGLHDLPALTSHRVAGLCAQFLGGSFEQASEAWADASPVRFVDERSAPMLLVHAPDDPSVPYDQSLRLAMALIGAGRPVEFMPVPGAGHGFVYNPDGPWTRKVWPVARAWLRRFLEEQVPADVAGQG